MYNLITIEGNYLNYFNYSIFGSKCLPNRMITLSYYCSLNTHN